MAKIFDLLLSGDRFRLSFIHGKKFYTGSVSRALAERGAEKLVGGRRPDLTALLFPVPPLEGEGCPRLVTGRREALLEWRAEDGALLRRTVLDAVTARPLRTEIFGGSRERQAVIHYRRPVEKKGLHPVAGFKVRTSGRSRFRMKIGFIRMQINGPVKDAAFRLKEPAGFEIIDAEEKKPDKSPAASSPEGRPEKR
jgi:hypothetical protein